ncbi:MAG: DUF975 family protein [Oscillospiraceae bacterium]|nr:DUF975 family protein [Oscillospiraceae bacterium]
MGYDHDRIKSNARLFYKNNQGNSILSILIFFGVFFGASYVMSAAVTLLGVIIGVSAGVGFRSAEAGLTGGYAVVSLLQYIIGFVLGLAMYPLMIGLYGWYTKSIYQKTSLGEIFTPYKPQYLWSNIGTGFLVGLFTYLWALLFIIPGIIKTYSYSQTMYIKAENPNIPASRAIELSKIMMDGHKGQLFYLYLSFWGWLILSVLTFNILGIIYVFPYYYAARAFAYEEVKADAAARGIIDIREINPNYGMNEIYPEM